MASERWIKVWVEILEDELFEELTPAHRWLGLVVMIMARPFSGKHWCAGANKYVQVPRACFIAGQRDIAAKAKLDRKTVSRGLVQLEAAKFLLRKDVGSDANGNPIRMYKVRKYDHYQRRGGEGQNSPLGEGQEYPPIAPPIGTRGGAGIPTDRGPSLLEDLDHPPQQVGGEVVALRVKGQPQQQELLKPSRRKRPPPPAQFQRLADEARQRTLQRKPDHRAASEAYWLRRGTRTRWARAYETAAAEGIAAERLNEAWSWGAANGYSSLQSPMDVLRGNTLEKIEDHRSRVESKNGRGADDDHTAEQLEQWLAANKGRSS